MTLNPAAMSMLQILRWSTALEGQTQRPIAFGIPIVEDVIIYLGDFIENHTNPPLTELASDQLLKGQIGFALGTLNGCESRALRLR